MKELRELKPSERVNQIISLILKERPELTPQYIMELIEKRVQELGGLLKLEGAALLVARELGVRIPKEEYVVHASRLKLSDLVPGLRRLNLVVRIIDKELSKTKNGNILLRLLVSDGTRIMPLKIWGEEARKLYEKLKVGECIIIENAYTKRYRQELELGLSAEGRVLSLPEDRCTDIPPLKDILLRQEDTIVFRVAGIYSHNDYLTVLGLLSNGKILFLRIPHNVENTKNMSRGSLVAAIGVKTTYESDEYVDAFAFSRSKVLIIETKKTFEATLSAHLVDDLKPNAISDCPLIRGFFLACIPMRKDFFVLYIGGRKNYLSIAISHKTDAASFSKISQGQGIVIGPLKVTNGRPRLTPRPYLSLLSEMLKVSNPQRTFIAVAKGPVTIRAAIVRADIRVADLNGSSIISARLTLDDSTGSTLALSSKPEVVAKLLSIPESELETYLSEGSLRLIADYAAQYLLGAECLVTGFSYSDLMLIEKISLLDDHE